MSSWAKVIPTAPVTIPWAIRRKIHSQLDRYCGLFEQGEKIRAIVYAGDEISKEKNAGDIVKSISQILGGAGGGSAKFAQGGGTDKSKKEDAIKNAKSMIIE